MVWGIICEFNPFHKGHKYLIDSIKDDGDCVVCVMSGNVVQRGEFAVYDKFARAKEALMNGADLVLELPSAYSSLSAEGFAKNAVKILEATGVVDKLAFGCECDDKEELIRISKKIKSCDSQIKEEMKKGISYPAARKSIIKSDILDHPNNILALEYIAHTSLDFKAIKRIGKGHDSDDRIYSASEIRKSLSNNDICTLKNCEKAVLYKLRTMSADDFLNIDDVNEGLENRLVESVRSAKNLEDLYDLIKTKRYTHSRIRRIILRSYLGITKNYSFEAPYIRILGFNKNGQRLLGQMKESSNLPLISRYNDITKLDDNGKKLFELECRVTDIYNLGYKKILPCGEEQRSKVVII